MKRWLALVLGAWVAGVGAAEVTVIRPRGFVSDEWAYYVLVGGNAVTDVRAGERVVFQVATDTRSLVIQCPRADGRYEESRIDYDFKSNAHAFFVLHTTRDCVTIEALDAARAAPLVRQTVARANRRLEYDKASAASAPAATPAPAMAADVARDQVAAATTAWADAFNSRDTARVVALYDSEAILTDTSEAKARVGTSAIVDYYKSAAQRQTQRVALGERTIRLFGDTAIDSGTFTFFEMRDGQASTTPARYSLTYRNRGGKWLIVDHQSSPVPR
ncbi:MAG TPA: SgcJ/EcaC family oxidoreductase [Burkholderiales bacterium]|nr:SgcJ/EcaC family oxidoreductase [Burkholderiales bacterium]